MDLDISFCLKSLKIVYQQFRSNKTDETTKDLERELNLLIGIASHGDDKALEDFSPQTLLHADSVSILVSILNDAKIKSNIHSKAMALLSCLAKSEKIRKCLQDTFKLTTSLVNFLLQHSLMADESLTVQCLELLQQITYELKINHPSGEVENLIKYLVSKVSADESSLTMPCLGSLANIVRSNRNLLEYIKSMGNIKGFFRKVTEFMCHDNWMKIIYSLTILLIFVDEPIGEKVFNKKNKNEIFQLVFNVILKGKGEETKKHSCNLFIDLIRCSKMQKYLAMYSDLPCLLKQVINLLQTSEKETSNKILELFIELCEVECLQSFVVKAVLGNDPAAARSDSNSSDVDCLSTIINILTSSQAKQHTKTVHLALKLINSLYKIMFSNGSTYDADELNIAIVLPAVFNVLIVKNEEVDMFKMEEIMKNARCCLDILILFCQDNVILRTVVPQINTNILAEMVQSIYQRFGSSNKLHLNVSKDIWNVISSVVIGLVELVSIVEQNTECEKEELSSLLQSKELPCFLAASICSGSEDLIYSSIQIIIKGQQFAATLNTQKLSELMASNNKASNIPTTTTYRGDRSVEIPFSLQPTSFGTNNGKKFLQQGKVKDEKTEAKNNDVDELAERANFALEIKEGSKIHEIMDIYEHRLAAVEARKNHVQDVLDSKSALLVDAERLLSEYRCSSAQSEAECLKLRSLLLESQRAFDQEMGQIGLYMKEIQRMEAEIASLSEENKTLEVVAEEYEQLKISYQDQAEKLLTLESNLSAVEEEHSNLSELNEMLRKHNENLKSKYDSSQQQQRKLETENQNISLKLKDKDRKYEELAKELAVMEKTKREKQELETKLKGLEEKLGIAEKERDELHENVDEMKNKIRDLQEKEEEYEQLKVSYQELNQRLETAKRALEVAETENKSLSDMESMLRKQGESLKVKHEGVLQQFKESEKEKQSLTMKLKEKEKKLEVLTKSVTSLKEDIKVKEKGKLELEQKLKNNEKQLKQTEKAKSDLNHKVSSMKLLNEKYEKEIQLKDEKIKDFKTKLEKQSQIAAMIHNLSSGQAVL